MKRVLLAVLLCLAPTIAGAGTILDATNKSIRAFLGGTVTTNQPIYTTDYADLTTTTFTGLASDGTLNNTTAVTIISSPAASTQRQVKHISIYNADTVAVTVTVELLSGASQRTWVKVTLAVDDTLTFEDDTGWRVIDTSGQIKSTVTANTELPTAAALADNTANPTVPAVGSFNLWWDGATWDRAPGTAADGALVNLGANNDVTVTGTVTANAGTNLNTSALSLEATQLNVLTDTNAINLFTDLHNAKYPTESVPADDETNSTNITRTGVWPFWFDGSTWDRARGSSADGLLVNLGTNNDVIVSDGGGALNVIVDSITAGDTDIGNVDLEFAGTAASTGVGASGAQTLRVAALIHDGTDTALVSAAGSLITDVANLPNEGQQTAANSISVTPDTDNDAIGAQGAAPPGEYTAIGGVTSGATGGFLNGIPVCTEFFAVDIVTATTTLAITGVSGRHVYICSLNLVTAAANNVAIIAGTGATCGTSTAGLNGGVTAAEGWNFAANGGIAQGSGLGAVMSTLASGGATGDSVCIITSAATQLAGTIGYAIF